MSVYEKLIAIATFGTFIISLVNCILPLINKDKKK